MLYLLLRLGFTVSFSHLLRLSQARTRRPMLAACVNYVVAAVACALWAAAAGNWNSQTLILGGLAGFTYVSSLVLMLPTMRRSGVSITGAVVQLSLMVPVAVSIWRFGERPNELQTLGILTTAVALPLLAGSSGSSGDARPGRLSPLAPILFLSTGASQVVMKEFAAVRPPGDLPLYSAALFASASVFTALWMAFTGDTGRHDGASPSGGEHPQLDEGKELSEGGIGVLLGIINVLQLVFLLLALRELPAIIVFPVSAALGIAVNAVLSMALWKERPRPSGWLGIALAVVAVVLLNWKTG